MNMVYEGLRQKGSMIIVPSTAVETMGLGALGGLTSFGESARAANRSSEPAAAADISESGTSESGTSEDPPAVES